ncbi:serine/threonine protein kinase [Streptomyces populi]|uniref:Serine/threonine protein kinase n=1 Tax=Streptomyces populi TaxID=2058924 RepID=A0A2I0SYJ6_9ACTN|nr:serine/threonine-protein kinase [Streptomyces populi]PKT75017.1 serine/threonine protein kinase [Streptomyces populi]
MSESGSSGRVQPAHAGDPSRIGPYRIVGRLGAGGMGTVHAGVAPDGMRVAVKVIHPSQAQDPHFRARFRREVEMSSRVAGPYLIPLLTADANAANPWLATEYVAGPTLNQQVLAQGRLTGPGLYAFAAATAQALSAVHAAGVVHRDVKPQNVILTPSGPRVLDFGIAHADDDTRATHPGATTGTPGWISPEQYRTGATGPEGDMFAWGALVAYAATGRPPFGTGAPDAVAFRVTSGEPDLDGVPVPLREIVRRALSKEPGDRPSADDAAEECFELLAAQLIQAMRADTLFTRAEDMITAVWDMPPVDDPAWPKPARRGRRPWAGMLVVAAAVIGGLAGGVVALMPGKAESGRHETSDASSVPASSAPVSPAPLSSVPASSPAGLPKPSGASAKTGTKAGTSKKREQAVSGGPASAESWAEARPARGEGEHDVARAVLHDQGLLVQELGDGIDLTPRSVRFHVSREEVYLSYRLSSDEPGTVYAETEVADLMCRTLRDTVLRLHPDLPYRTYVMVKETTGHDPQVTWDDDFLTGARCASAADDALNPSYAGLGWEPDEQGLGQAMVPSTDSAEIDVADRATRRIIERTNGMRGTLGTGRVLGNAELKMGFDPGHSAMYVWSDYRTWNQEQAAAWADMAAGEACRALVRQRDGAGDAWPYSRYAVAERSGSGYLMIRWGTAGTLADCPV